MLQLLRIWINSRTAKLPEVEGEIRRPRLDPVPLPVARRMTSSQQRDRVRAIDALPRVPTGRVTTVERKHRQVVSRARLLPTFGAVQAGRLDAQPPPLAAPEMV